MLTQWNNRSGSLRCLWLLSMIANVGCVQPVLDWSFALDEEMQERAAFVVAEVRAKGCDSDQVLYCSVYRREGEMLLQSELTVNEEIPPGEYCLVGFGLDADGQVVGRSYSLDERGAPLTFHLPMAEAPALRISAASHRGATLVMRGPSCGPQGEGS